jgi:hypothetical protein
MTTYTRGDVIQVRADWEREMREYVVLDDRGHEAVATTVGHIISKENIRATSGRLNEDDLYARRQAELLKQVPPEFHGFLSSKAWEDGHSGGYDEVINYLTDLVTEIIEPIEDFEKRIRKPE